MINLIRRLFGAARREPYLVTLNFGDDDFEVVFECIRDPKNLDKFCDRIVEDDARVTGVEIASPCYPEGTDKDAETLYYLAPR